jgi:hypothetical protein
MQIRLESENSDLLKSRRKATKHFSLHSFVGKGRMSKIRNASIPLSEPLNNRQQSPSLDGLYQRTLYGQETGRIEKF